ncbi:2-C-methyl-D-erythritol 4-phosphate cytidylyltransferase [Candidatus Desantisbacteria bacterium CG07_land_8_20_14_0_80_39_15]|uniref:2-C-methyl-D-erythritol 4-phosphate cytidylyltransferase n=1 Tax=Candidatus Desantisbacteria bacterium CG07_land_8_20_14_0_80_39_15 TaxID=1974549 RepID=A0A2M6ZGL2_9BACT|nr:MAG: 2-C-methyl-D-erythritol 4-phosphate cytidylyltransferase [Candidatus Desantisbacteria bacterium CG07_land_8_20_14_0_80_39_15]
MKVSVIIVAAGKGIRLSDEGSFKQFLSLVGNPVLVHAISVFDTSPLVDEIIIVVPAEKVTYCRGLVKKYKFKKVAGVIAGGKFRQDSVYNGLLKIGKTKPDIVLIHDGVRPLVTSVLIQKCIGNIRKDGAVVLAVPVKDTIKLVRKSFVEKTLERNKLWSIQTPQCFSYDLIFKAHKKARADGFLGSDDASLVERLGCPVKIEMGLCQNIKITTPEDLILAEEILKRRGV